MKKQTAVEYLIEQLFPKALGGEQYYHIEIAKAMEKEQMTDSYVECYMNHVGNGESILGEANRYYNKTYGGDK